MDARALVNGRHRREAVGDEPREGFQRIFRVQNDLIISLSRRL